MYTISLDENQEKFENAKYCSLTQAIENAVEINKDRFNNELSTFTVATVHQSSKELEKFKSEFVSLFKDSIENFFFEKMLDITGLEEESVKISYFIKEDSDIILTEFFDDYCSNLNINPFYFIEDKTVFSFESYKNLSSIYASTFVNVPETDTVVCNLKLYSGESIAGVSYAKLSEVLAKNVAYEDAIKNLLKHKF